MRGNFKENLARFLYGRYGIDSLYYGMFALDIALLIVNLFVSSFIIDLISWAIIVLIILRFMSKNIVKRRAENEKFLKIWNPVKGFFARTFGRIRYFHKKIYRKCPSCKATIRLPYKKGSHTVECPRCHKNFNVMVRL